MSDGSTVERDFTFVDGPAFKKWRRDPNGIDRRVRMVGGALAWPGDIDFDLEVVVWGGNQRRRRPIKRAVVSYGGILVPAPWVNEI
jgi:hypothetical protein